MFVRNLIKKAAFVAVLILAQTLPPAGFAQDGAAKDPVTYFSAFDETSEMAVDHGPLTEILKSSVLPMGRSPRRLGFKGETEQFVGTRLKKTVNNLPSRYENNRLMIHAFRDEHEQFFEAYQEGLERLSNRRPLSTWNKEEQLAFWLNLYTVVVMNKIIDEYPISRTRKLRDGADSFWFQKTANVEGIPLSLTDIERIVITNWPTPLVIYGFWQGSIGGPRLPRDAYTGNNVWDLLQKNATEFVNSNRGVIPKKDRLEVSIFFEWMKGAFRFSDARLLDHINRLADPAFLGDISHLSTIDYDYYDWQIADLVGGTLYTGPEFASNIRGDLFLDLVGTSNSINRLPPQALEMFREMSKEQAIPDLLKPVITTEECAPDEDCSLNQNNE